LICKFTLSYVYTKDHRRIADVSSGGTNLRVAFVEVLANPDEQQVSGAIQQTRRARYLRRHLEHSWPIQDHLKIENSESLFSWIGQRVAQVVAKGCDAFALSSASELAMGVTFSFPMKQSSLSQATLMAMGKGFAITSDLDLGGHLMKGYEKHRTCGMPVIRITAISNDAVATLVSFIYQFPAEAHQKAVMGLIVGTGCNATIPLRLSSLHQAKRPISISVLPGQQADDVKIAVNTELGINGTAPPLRKFGWTTPWDETLDKAGEAPGFQPLEYMTAGRYLGELARLMFVDYLSTMDGISTENLPLRLHKRFGLSTTFASHFYPGSPRGGLVQQVQAEFPGFEWTETQAYALYRISKAIQIRASGIVAASTVGLLDCAGEITEAELASQSRELVVGYTGGCIQYFQDYLADTQEFIDQVMERRGSTRIILRPCHDGGITGAGILVPAALSGTVIED